MKWFYEWIEKRPPKRKPLPIEFEVGVMLPLPVAGVAALVAWALKR